MSEPAGIPFRNVLRALRGYQAIPAAIIAVYILAGMFGPWVAPFDPADYSIRDRHSPPLSATGDGIDDASRLYVLGTDMLGRDVLSLWLHGARDSLSLVGISVFLGVVLGTLVTIYISSLPLRRCLVAYGLLAFILIPPALFSVNYPFGLTTLYFWEERFWDEQNSYRIVNLAALTTLSILLTTVVIGLAFYLRSALPIGRLAKMHLRSYGRLNSRYLTAQLHGLEPWISLSAVSSLLLTFKSATLISFGVPHLSWVSIAADERNYGQSAYWVTHITSTAV